MPPTIDQVMSAAADFKRDLRVRAGVTDANDKRSCKELIAHGMVEHKHNQLLVQACEIIDDFMLVLPTTEAFPEGWPR
jgi:hypothetical protein